MREDGEVVTDVYATNMRDLPRQLYNDAIDTRKFTLDDYLTRYAIIKQGAWSTSDVRGKVLQQLQFPRDLLNNIYDITQNTRKVDGFVGLKAKVRVKIEVNSQPYQAGILLAHYIPYADYMNSHSQWYGDAATVNPVAATGCASVTMNLANSTSMEFCTPYISPYLFANLVTGQGSFGSVTISVLSSLASQSATTVNYTIWARFEDIELVYPTPAPLIAGNGWAQVGGEMQTMETKRTISGAVGTVGSAVASVLPYVGLGWLAKPVEVLSTATANVLKWFGFSKPSVQAPVMRTLQSPARFMLNADGSDTGHKLGLSAANELQTFSGWAGTDEDEMRFDYICSRPCYTGAFNWKTGDAADAAIATLGVSPLYNATFGTTVAGAYANQVDLPLWVKVASMFNLWRGDLVFHFKFCKTQFHSGRLRFSFLPYAFTTAQQAAAVNMPGYGYTEDVDVSTASEYTFRVPFTAVRPWLNSVIIPDVANEADIQNVATGVLQVSVINPLVASSTVSSTVEVLYFTSLDKAQFASPIRTPILPFGIPNVAQVGGERNVSNAEACKKDSLPMLPYMACTGEVTPSFRQLLKRFDKCGTIALTPVAADTATAGTTGTAFTLFPWAPVPPHATPIAFNATTGNQIPQYTTTNTVLTNTVKLVPDLYSSVYPLFAFMRGSMRIKLAVNLGTFASASLQTALSTPIKVYINMYTPAVAGTSRPTMNPNAANSNLTSGPIQILSDIPKRSATGAPKTNYAYQPGYVEPNMVVYLDKEGCVEFEVPFAATGHMVPTSYGIQNLLRTRSIQYPFPIVTVSAPELFSTGSIDVYRAVGDDFSFGGLLGCPSHAYWSSTVNPV